MEPGSPKDETIWLEVVLVGPEYNTCDECLSCGGITKCGESEDLLEFVKEHAGKSDLTLLLRAECVGRDFNRLVRPAQYEAVPSFFLRDFAGISAITNLTDLKICYSIPSIAGIEFCYNLRSLNLGNKIPQDLGLISGLGIEILNIGHDDSKNRTDKNDVDLSALRLDLPNLQEMCIGPSHMEILGGLVAPAIKKIFIIYCNYSNDIKLSGEFEDDIIATSVENHPCLHSFLGNHSARVRRKYWIRNNFGPFERREYFVDFC